jgi:hypothetical protein
MSPRKHDRVSEPALARKNMDMDVRKLTAARSILGARSDTETVELALDEVIFQATVGEALDRLSALGGLDDIYAELARKRRTVRKR